MHCSTLQACKNDLFTSLEDLNRKYPKDTARRVLRIRSIHQWMLEDPSLSTKELSEKIQNSFKVSQATSYGDIKITRQLLPALTETRRSYYRWQANEMLLEIYRDARKAGDTAVMARVSATYAKVNRADEDDDDTEEKDAQPVQPFVPTLDPTVLGLTPIPNLDRKIAGLIEKYTKEAADIEDINYEEADLQEDIYGL